MPFVFLLLFALLSLQTKWPDPPSWLDLTGSLVVPWVMVVLFWLLASWQSYQFRRQLADKPLEHAALWRRFTRFRRNHQASLIAAYLAILFYFGWGEAVRVYAGGLAVFPGVELLQFAPLLCATVLAWNRFYDVEKASFELTEAPERFIPRSTYLAFQAQHNLLLVVPPVVLYLLTKLILIGIPDLEQHDTLLIVFGIALLVFALVSVPWILRLFLRLKPLPAGPLRDRLEATARRLGFGFNDVLLWDTRGSAANAMVSGMVPWVRYIVLTDLLVEKLTPDEIEAVFGHEVGHIKHHHMLLYVLFFLGSLVMLTGLWKYGESVFMAHLFIHYANFVRDSGHPHLLQILAGPGLLCLTAVYIFFMFGYLSRRCESQADLFGCRTVSSQAFLSALEKVADINGIPRKREGWLASWQHPSIAERVEFIQKMQNDPALEPRFRRSLGTLKWGMMGFVATGLALLSWVLGAEQMWDIFKLR